MTLIQGRYIKIASSSNAYDCKEQDPLRISIPETRIERVLWSSFQQMQSKILKFLKFSNRQYSYVIVMPDRDSLEEVVRMVEQNEVRAVVDRIYPMAESAAAHRYVEEGHVKGKVVILID